MWQTPQRLLISYAGLLVVLGFTLSLFNGFEHGWRMVGMSVAILCAMCALIVNFGAKANYPRIKSLGMWCGLIIITGGAFNFLRLAIKWHRAEFGLPIDSAIAVAMAITGLVAAVVLWKQLAGSSPYTWTSHIKRAVAICGALAMTTGFLMTKSAVLPQSASAMLESVVSVPELVAQLPDSALTDHIIEAALTTDRVHQALMDQGLTTQQIEGLVGNPELRSAALQVLRTSNDTNAENNVSNLAAVFERTQQNIAAHRSANSNAGSSSLQSAQQLLAMFSKQELEQLARSMNINPADFGIHANAIGSSSDQLLEQYMDHPAVQAALMQYQNDIKPELVNPRADNDAAQPTIAAFATRQQPLPLEQRLAAQRYTGERQASPETGIVNTNQTSPDNNTNTVDPNVDTTSLALLTETVPSGLLESTATQAPPELERATAQLSRMYQPNETPATSVPATVNVDAPHTLSATEFITVANTIRSEILAEATRPAAALPNVSQWNLLPGGSLSRTGLVVLVIGAALLVSSLALGRVKKPQTAAP